jgi:hypothetical protein
MKTKSAILTWFIVLALASCCLGQTQFPNPSFEGWTKDANNFLNPTSWATSNMKVVITSVTTVTKDSIAVQNGSYCAKLESKDPIGTGTTIAPGLLTLGKFTMDIIAQTGTVSGGVLFHDKPTSFRGYYKSTPQSGDQCFIAMILFKWNTGTSKLDTIAQAYLTNAATVSSWTYFDIPVDYRVNDTPDTMNIVIMSSDGRFTPKKGSILWVDNLSFGYDATSVNENKNDENISVFPNPVASGDLLNIDVQNYERISSIKITDIEGDIKAIINKESMNGRDIKIDMTSFAAGTYIIQIVSDNEVWTKKIIKL